MTSILEDILTGEEETYANRIEVRELFENNFSKNMPPADRTVGQSKSLVEFYELILRGLQDYEARAGTPLAYQINFTEEDPDLDSETETITFRLMRREPGSFSQGTPFAGDIKNLRPILREKGNDPENPDYKYAITGYWYDNLVRFTCWAKTNKQANSRACWFEDFMEDYTWWFRLQGVSRVLFWGRGEDQTITVDNNKWYGRPLNYFVRTEKIRVFEEKKLEQILVNLTTET
jgi:hypothetical protein